LKLGLRNEIRRASPFGRGGEVRPMAPCGEGLTRGVLACDAGTPLSLGLFLLSGRL
jgi:hypothetical protein